MVSSDSAPAAGWATTTCPPGPLSMLRGSSTVASRRCTRRGRARRRRRAPRCPRSPAPAARGRRAPATRRAPAARRGRGRGRRGGRAPCLPLRRGRPAQVHGPAAGQRERARARWRRRAAGRRRSWPDGLEHRRRRRGGRRRAHRFQGAAQPVLAEGLAAGAVRSSTPSETRTTSSSGAIVAWPVSLGGSRRSSPRTGPSPPSSARSPRSACQTTAPGARSAARSATTTGRPSCETALMKISGTSSARSASWMLAAASARSPPPRRARGRRPARSR